MSDEDFCTICLENVDEENRFVTQECGHHFGKQCIAEYVDQVSKENEQRYHETDDELRPQLDMSIHCPVCRTTLNDEQFSAIRE
uniref:RING-type domain-containing protein n=1 Tax=Panagrolaimus sp. JU765 TaxID=591449 RepID=A0AC34Q9H8_9BILA